MDPAVALILITEVMYNPRSDERPPARTEWVELYNPGEEAVSLTGWYLEDEDGKTQPVGEGVNIGPHGAVVLVPGEVTAEQFSEAWGTDAKRVVPIDGWNKGGLRGLANRPTVENERLSLRKPDGNISDLVNYRNEEPWPAIVRGGPSIYLPPDEIGPGRGEKGIAWRESKVDEHGGKHPEGTDIFAKEDIGSPGVVVTREEGSETPTESAAEPTPPDVEEDTDAEADDGM